MAAVSQAAKDKRKAYLARWYAENKDRISAQSKERYSANREKILKRQKEKDTQRPYRYKRLYGISLADYDRMLSEQSGGCAICGTTVIDANGRRKYFCVDHCHATGSVRGLLCVKCNIFLGHFEARMDRILAYLRKGN